MHGGCLVQNVGFFATRTISLSTRIVKINVVSTKYDNVKKGLYSSLMNLFESRFGFK